MCANSRSTKPLASSKHVASFIVAAAILLMGLSVLAFAVNTGFAGIVISTNSNNTATAYPVSSTDLIEGATPIVNTNSQGGDESTATSPGVLTNGIFTPGKNSTDTYTIGPSTITYNLGSAPKGYNVTNINTYSSWQDYGRVNQDYTVWYSTVSAPSTFIELTPVNYDPSTYPTGPSNVNTTEVLINSTTGLMATGAEDIQFVFSGVQNGYVGYNEFDVIGSATTPEPSSIVALLGLCGMGLIGLVCYRRRKAQSLPIVKTLAFVAAAVLTLEFAGNASAANIILDTFTDANGTSISSHIPDTNLPHPGGSYSQTGSFSAFPGTIQNNAFATNANDGAIISIESNGTYTKPSVFMIQADLKVGTVAGPGESLQARGVGLGFYSSTVNTGGGVEVIQGSSFSGLVLAPNGNLDLYQNGAYANEDVAFGGTFNDNSVYTLRYLVNTATGAISDISLSGSTANYSSLTSSSFTDPDTFYAAITSSSISAGTGGVVDNFSVSSVPEPSSIVALLGLCGMGLIGLIRYRRRKAA